MDAQNDYVEVLHVKAGLADYYLEILYRSDTAEAGTWLMELPEYVMRETASYVFREHAQVRYIRYRKSYVGLGVYSPIDHRRIKLPSSAKELNARLSAKTRYNMRRERRMLEAEVGSLAFEEYEADSLPEDVFRAYMSMKEQNLGKNFVDFGSHSAGEYMSRAHVSNIYVMRSTRNGAVISMVLSCEQCRIPYMHNLAYDTDFARYSPGKMIYNHYLCELIRKGRTEVFLGGGWYDYKKHYGSIEDCTFHGIIYRYRYEQAAVECKIFLRKVLRRVLNMLPENVRSTLRAIKSMFRRKKT